MDETLPTDGVNNPPSAAEHYGIASLAARITDALKRADLDDHGHTDWRDLAPLDQFHLRGLAATQELAAEMHITPNATILDVGCGVGGDSRFLAATYGARVTGIDLTPSFVEAATMLSARAGLTDRTTFRVADALDLPFEDSSFGYAWTQHVAMNIRDRKRLYSEIFRVLAPRGLLAIHDVVQIDDQPLIFPVPWARGPETSFLLTSNRMRDALKASGFEIVSWSDTTGAAREWIAQLQAARKATPAPPPLGLHVVTAADFPMMIANLARNLQDGRVGLVQAILKRPGEK